MIGNWPEPDPVWLLLPLVFDLAEESRAQVSVDLPDVGQVDGQKLSSDFQGSILIYGADLLASADNQELVAVPSDLELIAGVCLICPLVK